MSSAWSRAGCLAALVFSLAAAPTADAAPLRFDAGFGEGGIARVRFESAVEMLAPLRPVRQPDGKVLVAAGIDADHGNSEIRLARFTRSGRPDPTFGHRGRERLGGRWNFEPYAVHVQPDGRILVLGAAGHGPGLYPTPAGRFGLARLLPDGSRDPTFGTNGFVIWSPPWRADTANLWAYPGVFVPRPDGRIFAAGVWEEFRAGDPPGPSAFWERRLVFVRFDENGSLDASFGHAGWIEGPDTSDSFNSWAALPDGHIVALTPRSDGYEPHTWWLHRFTADGAVDREFGQDGSVYLGKNYLGMNMLEAVKELLPGRYGSLVMVGTIGRYHPAGTATAVRRIMPDGELDARFGTACGRRWLPGFSLGGAALTRNGGVFVAGSTYVIRGARHDGLFARYDADGCVADQIRARAVSAGPPLLSGRRTALVGATTSRALALIRIRR